MSIAEELREIEEMYAQGTLTAEEFAQAKAKVLDGDAPPLADSQTARQIARLQQQNAVAQLDSDWETDREQYMLKGRYGSYSVPTESGSIVSVTIGLMLGVIWVVAGYALTSSRASSHAPGALLSLAGVIFAVYSVIASINSYGKAGQYREAEQRYQEERAQLLAESDEA